MASLGFSKALAEVRQLLTNSRALTVNITLYLFSVVTDYISTILGRDIPGVWEMNPTVRDEHLRFVLWKGITEDILMFSALCLVLYAAHTIMKPINSKIPSLFAASCFFFLGASRIFLAVIPNLLIWLKNLPA
jgi:hypothetical protein